MQKVQIYRKFSKKLQMIHFYVFRKNGVDTTWTKVYNCVVNIVLTELIPKRRTEQ